MTDLTKQWKKGELLDEEDYYIKWKDSEVFTATFVDFMNRKMFQRMTLEFEELPTEHYLSVLAPVPSYDDWMATRGTAQFLMDKNAQHKEILKECREILKMVEGETMDFSCTVDRCIEKINQALGEDK